jgi:hypothetical protein
VNAFDEEFQGSTTELSLTVAELVDLIEIGAIAENESGWDFPILVKLREQFTRLVQDLNADADEV